MENRPKLLRIMVVDDNYTCLRIMSKILGKSNYEVAPFESAGDALYALQEGSKADRFDLALIEPHVGVAGFSSRLTGSKLLDYLQKSEIPVFTMCVHKDSGTLFESINMGTSFHFNKPLTAEKMDYMRQHALQNRTKKTLAQFSGNFVGYGLNEMIGTSTNRLGKNTDHSFMSTHNVMIGTSINPLGKSTTDNFMGTNMVGAPQPERESDAGFDSDEEDGTMGKKRIRWNEELHNRFLIALESLKEDRISPVNIMRAMDVKGITTKHVASHLQKYRRYLREGSSESTKRIRREISSQISFGTPSSFQASGSSSYSSNISLPLRRTLVNYNPLTYRGFPNPYLTNKYNMMNPISTRRLPMVYKPINPFLKPFHRGTMMNSYAGFRTNNHFMQSAISKTSFMQNYNGSSSMAPQVNNQTPFLNFGLMNNPNNMLNMPKITNTTGDGLWGLNWKTVEKEQKLDQNESTLMVDDQVSINVTPNGLSLAQSSGSSKDKEKSPKDVPIEGDNINFEAFILNDFGGNNGADKPAQNMNNDDPNYCFTFDEDKFEGFESLEELIGDKNILDNIIPFDQELEENNGEGNGSVKESESEEEKEKSAPMENEEAVDMEKFKSDENFIEAMLNN